MPLARIPLTAIAIAIVLKRRSMRPTLGGGGDQHVRVGRGHNRSQWQRAVIPIVMAPGYGAVQPCESH
jgi:hypothetical protein